MEYNTKLFFQGMFARLESGLGLIFLIASSVNLALQNFIIASILVIISITLIIDGGRRYFDYKRKSGYIIY